MTISNVAPIDRGGQDQAWEIVHGQTATYSYTITNTSIVSTDPVTITSIFDDKLGELITQAEAVNGGPIVLAPGLVSRSAYREPVLDDILVVNVVNVAGNDDENSTATTSDSETVTVNYPPVARITARCNLPGPVTLDVVANDSDPNSDLLPGSVDLDPATAGQQTTLTVAGQGVWSVDALGNVPPAAGFTLDPTPISYTISDVAGLVSNAATILIDYVPVAVVGSWKHHRRPPCRCRSSPTTRSATRSCQRRCKSSAQPIRAIRSSPPPGGLDRRSRHGQPSSSPRRRIHRRSDAIQYAVVMRGQPGCAGHGDDRLRPSPPLAAPDGASHQQPGPVTLDVIGNDSDPNGDLLPNTVDLDPTLPGRQTSQTVSGEGRQTSTISATSRCVIAWIHARSHADQLHGQRCHWPDVQRRRHCNRLCSGGGKRSRDRQAGHGRDGSGAGQ